MTHFPSQQLSVLKDSNSPTTRKLEALSTIQAYVDTHLKGQTNQTGQKKGSTTELFKYILKAFVDKAEPCREFSIKLVTNGLIYNSFDYSLYIEYAIPIMVHCLVPGQSELKDGLSATQFLEKSEEIRLALLNLLHNIVIKAKCENDLLSVSADIIAILLQSLQDRFHEINKRGCKILRILSTVMRLYKISEMVVETCLPLLGHKHSAVVLECVKLVHSMIANGRAHESIKKLTGFREHNIVPLAWWFEGEIRQNYFGGLSCHSKLAVREAFYNMISDILLNIPEMYDYRTLLLSYLISGLCDENKKIQQKTCEMMERFGKQYEGYNKEEFKQHLFFEQQTEAITKKHLVDPNKNLPFPFTHRPCYGSRVLLREHFGRVHYAILNELSNWKTKNRIMGLKLLKNLLVYCEEYSTKQTEKILAGIHISMQSVNDHQNLKNKIYEAAQRNEILETSRKCCEIVAVHIFPYVWMEALKPALMDQIERDQEWIEIFAVLVENAPAVRLLDFVPTILSALEALTLQDIKKSREHLERVLVKLQVLVSANSEQVDVYSKLTAEGWIHDSNNEQKQAEFSGFDMVYDGFSLDIFDERECQNLTVKQSSATSPDVSVGMRIATLCKNMEASVLN